MDVNIIEANQFRCGKFLNFTQVETITLYNIFIEIFNLKNYKMVCHMNDKRHSIFRNYNISIVENIFAQSRSKILIFNTCYTFIKNFTGPNIENIEISIDPRRCIDKSTHSFIKFNALKQNDGYYQLEISIFNHYGRLKKVTYCEIDQLYNLVNFIRDEYNNYCDVWKQI